MRAGADDVAAAALHGDGGRILYICARPAESPTTPRYLSKCIYNQMQPRAALALHGTVRAALGRVSSIPHVPANPVLKRGRPIDFVL